MVTQVLVIVLLTVFIGICIYLFSIVKKIHDKLSIILEIVDYYEKAKSVVVAVVSGPGKAYFEIAQSIFSTVFPLLTNRQKSK